jgi:hypothetical protein
LSMEISYLNQFCWEAKNLEAMFSQAYRTRWPHFWFGDDFWMVIFMK